MLPATMIGFAPYLFYSFWIATRCSASPTDPRNCKRMTQDVNGSMLLTLNSGNEWPLNKPGTSSMNLHLPRTTNEGGKESSLQKRTDDSDNSDDEPFDPDALVEENRHRLREIRQESHEDRIGEASDETNDQRTHDGTIDDTDTHDETGNTAGSEAAPDRSRRSTLGHTTLGSGDYPWLDRSRVLSPIRQYPTSRQIDSIVDLIQAQFFNRFYTTRDPIRTTIFQLPCDQFTVSVAWLNPNAIGYPLNLPRAISDVAFSPGDLHVSRSLASSNRHCRHLIRPPPKRPGPSTEIYDPFQRPILTHYMEMNMMGAFDGDERDPGGMGCMLVTRDGLFAFGYRIFVTRDGKPYDSSARRPPQLAREPARADLLFMELQRALFGPVMDPSRRRAPA